MTLDSNNEVVELISADAIARKVAGLGAQITKDYQGKSPLIIGVLRGAVVFMADLVRSIDLDITVDFMAVSSYGELTKSSGVVRIQKDLDEDPKGRHVILVEDIIDTGLTLSYILDYLTAREPASICVAALMVRKVEDDMNESVKYIGFPISDDFVVGYGLDLAGRLRNLPYVGAKKKT